MSSHHPAGAAAQSLEPEAYVARGPYCRCVRIAWLDLPATAHEQQQRLANCAAEGLTVESVASLAGLTLGCRCPVQGTLL